MFLPYIEETKLSILYCLFFERYIVSSLFSFNKQKKEYISIRGNIFLPLEKQIISYIRNKDLKRKLYTMEECIVFFLLLGKDII